MPYLDAVVVDAPLLLFLLFFFVITFYVNEKKAHRNISYSLCWIFKEQQRIFSLFICVINFFFSAAHFFFIPEIFLLLAIFLLKLNFLFCVLRLKLL